MKISNSAKYAVGVSLAVALLAGCTGNGGSQLAPTGPTTGANSIHMGANHKVDPMSLLVTPRSVKPNFHKVPQTKTMKPNCCALQKTAFISDAFGGSSFTGAIYAFDYVTGASLGTVAAPPEGFLEVQGGCADTSGNVYFANTEKSTVDEFSHSGTFITAIQDPGQYPVGCAYDPSSGDLAISNIISTSSGPGSLSIASGGSIVATYSIPNFARVYFLAYMGKTGTLYIDGENSSAGFEYTSATGCSTSCSFTPITISGGSILFPGSVNYSGKVKSMSVGDQDTFSAPTFYQVSSTGAITGSTVTTCGQSSDFCDIVQAAIKGPGLVGPDAAWIAAHRFNYPAGGAYTLNYPASYVQPIGSAVSPNKG